MTRPQLVRGAAVATSLVWTMVLQLSDVKLPSLGEQILANVPTLLALLTVAFDLWLWKWPVINRLHSRPRIYGSWSVLITPYPNERMPAGGATGPIAGTTRIEQTFWTLTISMKTGESESISRAEDISPDGGSRVRKVLTYTYTNTPQLAVRDRSPIHVGAAMLTIEGAVPQNLFGTYWTDRLSMGDLVLTRGN